VLSLHVVVGKSGRTHSSPLAAMTARLIARRADVIIAVSQEAADAFDGARVIAPAFDPLPPPSRDRRTVRDEMGVTAGDVVVVTVSRLEATKRLDLFINAVEAAGAVGWIVGDGAQRDALEALSSGSRTTLLGYRDDVADLLAAADVFALPSASETYGIAVAEAIAAGLPVVATTTGAIGELVGSAGVLVPPDDDDAFVDALVTLVGDEPLRTRRAGAAQSVVGPDAASLTAELGRVYDDVVARRRGRRG
jgi:glycosyltransferase involved in cell wall biosynthesis